MKTISQLIRGRKAMLEPTAKEAKQGIGPREVTVHDIIAAHGVCFLVDTGEGVITVAGYRILFLSEGGAQ